MLTWSIFTGPVTFDNDIQNTVYSNYMSLIKSICKQVLCTYTLNSNVCLITTLYNATYCSVQLREQLFEQEKKLLQSQNEWLNTELNSKSEAVLKLQKDRVSTV